MMIVTGNQKDRAFRGNMLEPGDDHVDTPCRECLGAEPHNLADYSIKQSHGDERPGFDSS
jgi:hypothetical protein